MYFDLSLKKAAILGAMVVALLGALLYTFNLKDRHYGDIRLPTAVKRWWQKESLLVKYSLRSVEPEGALSALGRLILPQRGVKGGGQAAAVPVLLYHSIVKEPDGHNPTEAEFASQMFALKRAGWQTITLEELRGFLRAGNPVPARSLVVTFDDGARDSYYPTDPIFQALGFNGVSFILPKHSTGGGSHYYLSAGEVKEMLASGRWEIGSHGQDAHDELRPIDSRGTPGVYLANRLWRPELGRIETVEEYRERVAKDLAASKANLEAAFKVPITTFAFPFGEFGQLASDEETPASLRQIVDQIYELAFYQTYRGEGFSYNYYDDDEPVFMVKRIGVLPGWDGEELLRILERGEPKNLPYRDVFARDEGWFPIWGDYLLADGRLRLKSAPDQTGNAVVLDGTAHWRDYYFKARVTSPPQTGVLLWVRMEDNKNHAACNFGNGFVHVEETLNQVRRVIRGERRPDLVIPAGEFTVAAQVSGRRVTCFLNGKKLVESTFLDPQLDRGGIGLKIWDPVPGKSELVVREVTVSPL